jgi:hypothetical protein
LHAIAFEQKSAQLVVVPPPSVPPPSAAGGGVPPSEVPVPGVVVVAVLEHAMSPAENAARAKFRWCRYGMILLFDKPAALRRGALLPSGAVWKALSD